MVSAEVARNIVGIIGNVISFALFLSPVTTFITIYKKKAVEEFKPDPYIATVMNCMLWVFYGIPVVHPDSTLVITINSVGLALEAFYLCIFMIYGENKHRKKIGVCVLAEVIFVGVVAVITILALHTHTARSAFVGGLCVFFGACMYASPMTVMYKVMKTKSVKYMPFLLSLTSFLNGLIWLTYALIKFDLYILIGNGLGALFGLSQLIVYAIYFKSTPIDVDEGEGEGEDEGEDDETIKPASKVELTNAV